MILNAANTYTGGTSVAAGGIVVFGSPQAIGGSGANVTVNYGATAAAGYPIDQDFLGRLAPSSSGVAALAVDSGNALSFAGLPGMLRRGGHRHSGNADPRRDDLSAWAAAAACSPSAAHR